MIVKKCNRCGKDVPVGKTCNCFSRERYKPYENDKYTADDKQFYKTGEWLKARELCIQKCHGIDLYSYYILHKIEFGQTVHHIVPLIDDYSLRVKQSNLIYLTESNHRTIHGLYKNDYAGTVRMLRNLLQRFSAYGVYRNVLKKPEKTGAPVFFSQNSK